MVNFIQDGDRVTVAAPYTVVSGAGVQVGAAKIFGVAAFDAASAAQVEIKTRGVFDLAKDTSTFADGDIVYWDNAAKKATSTSSSNTKIGVALLLQPDGTSALGASSGDATVRVRLNGTV